MDDVSKCLNATCAHRGKCWRYLTPAFKRQRYAAFTPDESGRCEHFEPLRRDRDKGEATQ